jgi:hypothetical protein
MFPGNDNRYAGGNNDSQSFVRCKIATAGDLDLSGRIGHFALPKKWFRSSLSKPG